MRKMKMEVLRVWVSELLFLESSRGERRRDWGGRKESHAMRARAGLFLFNFLSLSFFSFFGLKKETG